MAAIICRVNGNIPAQPTNQALIGINAKIDRGGLNPQGLPAVSWTQWSANNQNPCPVSN